MRAEITTSSMNCLLLIRRLNDDVFEIRLIKVVNNFDSQDENANFNQESDNFY